MEGGMKRRKKKKYICPNPLFEKWISEWKDDAKEKGMKAQYTYAKALSSLRKYPLPLASGKEAKILEYFGDKICTMLDAKLLQWKQANSASNESYSSSSLSSSSQENILPVVTNNAFLPSPEKKEKIKSAISKTSTIEIKTVNKGRIRSLKKSVALAEVIEDIEPDIIPARDDTFYLFPGSFSVILCIDNCETVSGQGKSKKLFLEEIKKCGLQFEVRKLHVGDFLWIARDNSNSDKELVLDFVVERKRLDDLARSIKDGRFREQKFRMRRCGLKKPVYLVENCSGAHYLGLPESSLEQAIINTQVTDGFLVKRTQNIKESVAYLSMMTRILKNKFQNQTLISASQDAVQKEAELSNIFMTFKEFNCSSVKNKSLTVKEMFAKHLLQFFGLSVDRVAAIVEHFETPTKFFEAYENCITEDEKIHMISSIRFGAQKKNIGPALSRSLHQFYCSDSPFR